jgi:hypothetical protein
MAATGTRFSNPEHPAFGAVRKNALSVTRARRSDDRRGEEMPPAAGDVQSHSRDRRRVDPKAADIAVSLMSAGVHDSLVVGAGWSHKDYEAWLKPALAAALLR